MFVCVVCRYGAWLPSIDDCPTEMALTMQLFRKTVGGKVSINPTLASSLFNQNSTI
jgi:hypothetical protein